MIIYEPPRTATTIAMIDLAGSFDDAEELDRVAGEMHRALRETGFFYVIGHGVPPDVIDRQFALTRALFDLDLDAKFALSSERSSCQRGYEGLGRQVLDEGSAADFKESFMLGRELGPTHPWVLAGLPAQGSNLWPHLPGFREQMEDWMDEMARLGCHLMACLARSVDLPADWFAPGLAEPQTAVRLLRYPPQPRVAPGNLLGAGAHSDWGSITILAQDQLGGLEVRGRDGGWIAATPLEGSFVINIGQMMERFSGGLYEANLHRVRNNHASAARHSVATFFELEPLYRMAIAPTCPGGDMPLDPHNVPTVGEHIEQMARASLGQ